jgi:hypothetical protein
MDFLCYLHPSWLPRLRPAEPTRPWMDATQEAFAYRCLPLNIANAHGWEVLNPCPFEAYWNGGIAPGDVKLRFLKEGREMDRPVALFGQGTITFHVQGLFRTPPGWNLWVGGSPNRPKDGIAPLTGVIETDWSPYTFTMNWRFTRRNHWIRFDEDEPFCFLFPVARDALERMDPKLLPIAKNPEINAQFEAWSRSRDNFQKEVATNVPAAGTDQWQKRYYRGIDMEDRPGVPDHRAKLRLKPFVEGKPAPHAPVQLEIEPDRLAAAIAAMVKDAGAGRGPAVLAARLTEGGLPPDVAAQIVTEVAGKVRSPAAEQPEL